MKLVVRISVYALITFTLGACSHGHKKRTVLEAGDVELAKACVNDSSVKAGDQLTVYELNCREVRGPMIRTQRYETKCEKKSVGKAEVIEATDGHIAKLKALGDTEFWEGQVIEKDK